MDVSDAKRGFFRAIGRRKSDYLRLILEVILVWKVVTGELDVAMLLHLL